MTARRRAELTVAAAAPETVAAAVAPDDTDSVTTEAVPAEGTVRLRVDRPTTGGLAATVDDAVVNLGVAAAVTEFARGDDASTGDAPTGDASTGDAPTDGNASTDERSGRGRRGHDGGTARRDAHNRRHTDDTHDT